MGIERWKGRVAVVTGSSSGIGSSIVVELCKSGLIAIGLARRVEKVEELKSQLTTDEQKNFHAFKCDVSKEEEIVKVFAEIVEKFGGIDVLINNAGIFRAGSSVEADNTDKFRAVIDTNLMGLAFCTREAVKSLRKRGAEGHIIHINSITGHFSPFHKDFDSFGAYGASKFAVTALTEQHRHDFIKEKLNIKVTSLSPGVVKTEIANAAGGSLTPEVIEEMYKALPVLDPKDIADAVIYILGTPPHVQVCELLIRPLNETF